MNAFATPSIASLRGSFLWRASYAGWHRLGLASITFTEASPSPLFVYDWVPAVRGGYVAVRQPAFREAEARRVVRRPGPDCPDTLLDQSPLSVVSGLCRAPAGFVQ